MLWTYSVPSIWAVWWIFPLMCIAFMIIRSIFFRGRGGHRPMCGSGRDDELDSLRREIRELRDEMAKNRKVK
jgi:hypothetical protein